jgi:hypothetical protein
MIPEVCQEVEEVMAMGALSSGGSSSSPGSINVTVTGLVPVVDGAETIGAPILGGYRKERGLIPNHITRNNILLSLGIPNDHALWSSGWPMDLHSLV